MQQDTVSATNNEPKVNEKTAWIRPTYKKMDVEETAFTTGLQDDGIDTGS